MGDGGVSGGRVEAWAPHPLEKGFPCPRSVPLSPWGSPEQGGCLWWVGLPSHPTLGPSGPCAQPSAPRKPIPKWLKGSRVAGLTSASVSLAQGWGCQTSLWSGSLSHGGSQPFPRQAGWALGVQGWRALPQERGQDTWAGGSWGWGSLRPTEAEGQAQEHSGRALGPGAGLPLALDADVSYSVPLFLPPGHQR